jgi:hypothetical protein
MYARIIVTVVRKRRYVRMVRGIVPSRNQSSVLCLQMVSVFRSRQCRSSNDIFRDIQFKSTHEPENAIV